MAEGRGEKPTSRARPGGAARPVPPRRSTRGDGGTPAGPPPSFAPEGGRSRPRPADAPPVVVGRPGRPAPPAGRPPALAPRGAQAAPPPPPPARGVRVPSRPSAQRPTTQRPPVARPARPRRRRRAVAVVLLAVLAAVIAWPLGLLLWANGRIQHVPALSGTPDTTPGTTYLLAGSDVRGDEGGIPTDGTEGARTDTVMILHVPPSGPAALISLPRDTYTEIPGHGPAKLNAAYAWGGPTLLVQTVEGLTGLHVDHYAEVTLGGVARVVDAVGGVELCMDPEVNKVTFPVADPDSGMVWDAPGCRMQSGPEALAFARMRKADHEGDIGRGKRQQQLIASVARSVADPSLLWQPTRQVSLLRTGLGAFTVSEGTNILDLGRLALAFRAATGPGGVRGTPPIASLDYRPGGDVGSTVLLDPEATPAFWQAIVEGTLPPGPVGGISAG
jgi:LCP family protein required for cell wall assembly